MGEALQPTATTSADAHDASGTPPETAIATIWRQILDVGAVAPEDDFFELGGDSLSAIHMLAAVEEALGEPVSFTDFLERPTVAALAAGRSLVHDRLNGVAGPAPAPAAAAGAPGDGAPCSFAQERLWFLEQLGGASAAYNMPIGARISGPLDVGALERALRAIVDRHSALRTRFGDRDGSPIAIAAADAPFALELADLRAHADPLAEAQRLVDALASAPLDLQHGPLMRALLVTIADDDHVLELVFHHIICDGWSQVVILRELGEAYRSYGAGEPPRLPEPSVQYADHARRERALLHGAALDERLAPWVGRLAGAPFRLDLPTDRPRPALPSYRGATLRTPVPAALAAAVRDFARAAGATQYATMLSAYYALLSRYSGQDEILVGATTAGRTGAELADGVGLFASTVTLRGDLTGEPTFRELVERVREVVLWAIAHQDAPFDALVARLAPERDLSRHPLFQVFCAHVPQAPLELLDARPFDAGPATSRFDLTLFIEDERDGGLELAWEYSTDLFEPATIERFARQYLHLLGAALDDPDTRVDALAVLDADETREVLAASAETATGFAVACMHERFERHAAQAPDAIAVRCEGASITYAALNEQANRIAHHLRERGASSEVLVGIFLEPSIDLVAAILGVLKAGAAYVPLDPEYPAERLGFILEDTRAPLLLTARRLLERLPDSGAGVICIDAEPAIAAAAVDDPVPAASPESLAYVIYTSGSTGRPKGVGVEHRNIARLFTATDEWFGFGPSDTWVLLHSYAFDFSVWELWGALAYGGTLVVSPLWTTRSPAALAELLASERVTVLNATPSLFAAVQEDLLRRASELSLRFVVFGGEALAPSSLRPWYDHHGDDGPTLVNMYGITETTVHVTHRPLRASDCELDASPIGVAIPDLSLYVLDAHGRPAPFGVAGELYVGGAGVARGYLNRPELTAERFIDNPFGAGRLYRSGDVALRSADGGLDFRGRIDDQVKIRGFRIELGEIVAAIREHPAVADAAVVAIAAAAGDRRLAAYVVAEPGGLAGERLRRDLLAQLESKLPAFMVPASVTELERIPLTRNGKIDRRALPAPSFETQEQEGSREPATPTELAVAEVWKDVLGLERVGADDSFFTLGGHSLLAARAITRARERFAIELSVRALFEAPTLAGFAARVDAAIGARDGAAAEEAPVETAAPDAAEAEVGTAAGGQRRSTFPLAFPQQQLLFFDELTPSTYNAALAIRVSGELDHELLRRALADLFIRHEALRTVFVWGEVSPSQIVLEQWQVELPVVDLSALGEEERAASLERLMREHALRPFDLAKDLMLRTSVFELGGDEHVILFQPHHIAFDAWAVEILYRDLGELYDAAREQRAPQLPELALGYGDFALEQRERMQGELLARKLDFWRAQLAGAPTALALPTDHRRPALQTFAGARREFELDRDLADAVRETARAAGATPYMVALAAFGALLYRLGGQDDILIGGPMANRDGPRYEHVIGFFANTVVVRARLGGNPTFAELVDRVRESVLRSYEHQDVPFELVVEALRPDRDPARNPIFQVNFRMRVGGMPELSLGGADARELPVDLGFARFELSLELHLHDDRIAGELIYNSALFGADSAARIAGEFAALLREAVTEPQTRLLSLELSSAGNAERDAAGVPAPAPRAGIRGFRAPGGNGSARARG